MHTAKLDICACLPFIELAEEAHIQLGPVFFWPASKFQDWITPENQQDFQAYIHSINQIKTKVENAKIINTVTLNPQRTTCISIDSDVPSNLREQLIIDSLYCLYFICNFRNLYYGNEVLPFDVFKKVIPASLEFIHNKNGWESIHINEMNRENTVCIHLFDQEMSSALGKAISAIYQGDATINVETGDGYRRLVRSIRFMVDRFFQRFVNLFDKGLDFEDSLFEPEDILFLSTSFDALLNISDKDPTSDFKHKLRPMLHLKYSTPVEIFWKWVDDFYTVKRQVVYSGATPDPIFRSNPNFEISQTLIGIKLFIYAVYNVMFKYKLISPVHFDEYTPPDFRWIHPEEILLFFWTESTLLEKLNVFIDRAQTDSENKELYAEVSFLSDLYLSIYERYYLHPVTPQVRFIPSPLSQIEKNGQAIIKMIEQEKALRPQGKLIFAIPNDLDEALRNRLASGS